ncbi:hypothetical protein GCM10009535_00180 [Streptomyces thermocarboxydovorans]|uniref:Uncharacterized protein n=1 Tax=Streptomyces thermocarboxydovorans TaxID=59298 RepID=A0ABP3S8M1_9ACTN
MIRRFPTEDVTIGGVTERFTLLESADETPHWRRSVRARGLTALPVNFATERGL